MSSVHVETISNNPVNRAVQRDTCRSNDGVVGRNLAFAKLSSTVVSPEGLALVMEPVHDVVDEAGLANARVAIKYTELPIASGDSLMIERYVVRANEQKRR
jgi:hypothetical protein